MDVDEESLTAPERVAEMSERAPSAPDFKLSKMTTNEREAVAFWFRRLATALAIGNGAGIIAVGSFVSNSKELRLASLVAYPGLKLFFFGAVAAFASFIFSLVYVGLRIDARAELWSERNDHHKIAGLKPPPSAGLALWVLFMMALQLGVLGLSATSFYGGVSQVAGAMKSVACSGAGSMAFCTEDDPFSLLVEGKDPVRANAIAALLPPALKVSQGVSGEPVFRVAPAASASDPAIMPLEIGILSNLEAPIEISNIEQEMRVIRQHRNDVEECTYMVAQYYMGSQSPILRNPRSAWLSDRNRKDLVRGGDEYTITFGDLFFTATQQDKSGQKISFLKVSDGSIYNIGLPPIGNDKPSLILPWNSADTNFVVLSASKQKAPACRNIAGGLGFRTVSTK